MLSYGWPRPLESSAVPIAVYVAVALPPTWEAAILLVGAALAQEFGSGAAILHPPHITLHPPFFPGVPMPQVIAQLERVLAEVPTGPITYAGVAGFGTDERGPTQVIMAIESDWCKATHRRLVAGLAGCWSPDDLMLRVWPTAHRLDGFTPHVSLAIGDLPPEPDRRQALRARAAEILTQALRCAAAPTTFAPANLALIAYAHDWQHAPYTVVAGPDVVARVPLGGGHG